MTEKLHQNRETPHSFSDRFLNDERAWQTPAEHIDGIGNLTRILTPRKYDILSPFGNGPDQLYPGIYQVSARLELDPNYDRKRLLESSLVSTYFGQNPRLAIAKFTSPHIVDFSEFYFSWRDEDKNPIIVTGNLYVRSDQLNFTRLDLIVPNPSPKLE